MEIGWALQALGQSESAAVPSLIIALQSDDEFSVRETLHILQGIEFDQHELDPLLEGWSKAGQHTNVVRVVAELQVVLRWPRAVWQGL